MSLSANLSVGDLENGYKIIAVRDGPNAVYDTEGAYIGQVAGFPTDDGTYTVTVANGVATWVAEAAVRFVRFTFTDGTHSGGAGFKLVVLQALSIYSEAAGSDLALTSTVTPQSTFGGYSATGLNDDSASSNWANGVALPQTVVVDMDAIGGIDALHSYSFRAATDSGNSGQTPIAWTVETGPALDEMTQVDSRTGQSFGTDNALAEYTVP